MTDVPLVSASLVGSNLATESFVADETLYLALCLGKISEHSFATRHAFVDV